MTPILSRFDSKLVTTHAAVVAPHSVTDNICCATFFSPCRAEYFLKCAFLPISEVILNLSPVIHRCHSSQRVGGRPFWSQCHHVLSAEEGQPHQHAHPEGSLLHQKTLCLHPQPGVHVEAGLGWVERSHVIWFMYFSVLSSLQKDVLEEQPLCNRLSFPLS